MLYFSFAATAIAALSICADATSVSVIEFGNGETIHRTTPTAPQTAASGVMSFFRSLHEVGTNGETRRARTTQYPGMNVVPSIFNRPDGGISIGIMGESIDLSVMPTLAAILEDEGAVGHFNMKSSEGNILKKRLSAETVDSASLETSILSKGKAAAAKDGNRLESLEVNVVSAESAAAVDATLSRSLMEIAKFTKENGSTIVVHVFVEENEEVFNDRLQRRRLEDAANDDAQQDEAGDDAQQDEADDDNADQDADEEYDEEKYDSSQFGYMKKNNVYYNPYRYMNDMQYSMTVLWTAIGLTVILFVANSMMLNMPLLPDTLLFGESAKVVAE